MRLIDKDSLWKEVTTRIEEYADIADIMEIIEHQPVVEERKTGTWLFIDDEVFAGYHICSNCGERAIADLYGEEVLANYCLNCGSYNGCENCGANMKGEE